MALHTCPGYESLCIVDGFVVSWDGFVVSWGVIAEHGPALSVCRFGPASCATTSASGSGVCCNAACMVCYAMLCCQAWLWLLSLTPGSLDGFCLAVTTVCVWVWSCLGPAQCGPVLGLHVLAVALCMLGCRQNSQPALCILSSARCLARQVCRCCEAR